MSPATILQEGVRGHDPHRYFPETGHTVAEEFLEFFDANGGLAIFGYPITDSYIDPESGLPIQYFQRARMERRPANPGERRICLGSLGEELHRHYPPANSGPVLTSPGCAYFPETGHSVCHDFLDFYRKHGGPDMFGYPISGFFVEDGTSVQYFQRARMEWYPEEPPGQRVRLAPLGSILYERDRLDPHRLEPQPPPGSGADTVLPSDLRLSARVSLPVVQLGDIQTIHVSVGDQYGHPVTGVMSRMIVYFWDEVRKYTLPPTDGEGKSQMDFRVEGGRPGHYVILDLLVAHQSLFRAATTSFLLWW